jgi:hypothetical protein
VYIVAEGDLTAVPSNPSCSTSGPTISAGGR